MSALEFSPGGAPAGQFEFGLDPAAQLAMRAVAMYPQSGQDKAATILAAYTLRNFEDAERFPVDIPQVARLRPDGELCAARANAVHEHFGIRPISPDEAAGFLRLLAATALTTILQETTNQASSQQRFWIGRLPHRLSGWQEGPTPIISIAAADRLHHYLSVEPEVRQATAATLQTRAQRLRAGSTDRQQALAADFRARRMARGA